MMNSNGASAAISSVDIVERKLLETVSERDVDFGLLSGLFASPLLRSFVIGNAIGWTGGHSLVQVRMSEWDVGRETDVLLIVALSDDRQIAIMIEDKISAIFQPEQAEGYRARGLRGRDSKRWTHFSSCLFAPADYIRSAKVADEWDAYLSFESIIQLATEVDDRNVVFLAAICSQAISKRIAKLLPVSPEASAFWQAYRLLASELLPEAPITPFSEGVSAARWPKFAARSLPVGVLLEHKEDCKRVDLTFEKKSTVWLSQKIPNDLPLDIKVVPTGRSAALRIVVPEIDVLKPFAVQEDAVMASLAAVERLLPIGVEIAKSL